MVDEMAPKVDIMKEKKDKDEIGENINNWLEGQVSVGRREG